MTISSPPPFCFHVLGLGLLGDVYKRCSLSIQRKFGSMKMASHQSLVFVFLFDSLMFTRFHFALNAVSTSAVGGVRCPLFTEGLHFFLDGVVWVGCQWHTTKTKTKTKKKRLFNPSNIDLSISDNLSV